MKPLSRRGLFGLALAAPVAAVVPAVDTATPIARARQIATGMNAYRKTIEVPWVRDSACDELLEQWFFSSFSTSVVTRDGEFHYTMEQSDTDDLATTIRRIWRANPPLGIGESDDD